MKRHRHTFVTSCKRTNQIIAFNEIGRLGERSRGGLVNATVNSRVSSRNATWCCTVDRAALHGHASLPPEPCPFRSARPLDPARRTRRGTPVWIIYSGCIPGEEGGNFRGAVLRWLRSFIASSPPYHLLHSLPSSPPTSSTRLLTSRSPPASLTPVRGHSPLESLRSAPREARGSARCYTLGSNLRTAGATQTNARCARREGVRRIFVFAHSRANAHPSSCGGIFRREENCPLSRFTEGRLLLAEYSPDRVLILIGISLLFVTIL